MAAAHLAPCDIEDGVLMRLPLAAQAVGGKAHMQAIRQRVRRVDHCDEALLVPHSQEPAILPRLQARMVSALRSDRRANQAIGIIDRSADQIDRSPRKALRTAPLGQPWPLVAAKDREPYPPFESSVLDFLPSKIGPFRTVAYSIQGRQL